MFGILSLAAGIAPITTANLEHNNRLVGEADAYSDQGTDNSRESQGLTDPFFVSDSEGDLEVDFDVPVTQQTQEIPNENPPVLDAHLNDNVPNPEANQSNESVPDLISDHSNESLADPQVNNSNENIVDPQVNNSNGSLTELVADDSNPKTNESEEILQEPVTNNINTSSNNLVETDPNPVTNNTSSPDLAETDPNPVQTTPDQISTPVEKVEAHTIPLPAQNTSEINLLSSVPSTPINETSPVEEEEIQNTSTENPSVDTVPENTLTTPENNIQGNALSEEATTTPAQSVEETNSLTNNNIINAQPEAIPELTVNSGEPTSISRTNSLREPEPETNPVPTTSEMENMDTDTTCSMCNSVIETGKTVVDIISSWF